MKTMLLAVILVSLTGLSLAGPDANRQGELSASQIKSMRQVGWTVLTARAKATEDPDVQQLRKDIKVLQQELKGLSEQFVTVQPGGIKLQAAGASPAPTVQAQAQRAAQTRRALAKQRLRNAMTQVRQRHDQIKKRKPAKGPLPTADVQTRASDALTTLQADIESALDKPDAELHAACKVLLKRVEIHRLMIGQPLDDQPTLSTRTRHRR